MNAQLTRFSGLFLLLALSAPAFLPAQGPTDNPYLTRYPAVKKHWSQKIKWDNTLDARKISGLVSPTNAVDSFHLSQILDSLSRGEGGVLFFPPGTYYFHFDLLLPDGVVLRGMPQKNKLSAIATGFKPLTHLIFPAYDVKAPSQVAAANAEGLHPTSTPRMIKTATRAQKNFGLAYLDIQNAVVNFSVKPFEAPMSETSRRQLHQQVLMIGLRLNDAALPDPSIPTEYQKKQGHEWQRWPWKAAANINVTADKNCAVVNCLFNDQPLANFRQNDFLTQDGMTFDGFEALYRTTDHPAIAINSPSDGKGSSTAVDNLEIADNVIWVSAGNTPILIPGFDLDPSKNTTAVIAEKTLATQDGKTAKTYPYNAVIDQANSIPAFTYHHFNGDSLVYRLIPPLNPDPQQRYPLVLFLHDYPDRGNDNRNHLRHFLWQLYDDEVRKQFPCYILAPQLPKTEEYWKAKYNFSNTWPLETCFNLVEQYKHTAPIDSNRCYVIGIGTGGSAAWDIAFNYPNTFAALAPLGGFFRFNSFSAKQISHHPMYIVWGDSDEWNSNKSQRFITTDLKTAGAKFKVKVLPATGKKCWNTILRDVPDFIPWLFSQKK